jgi:hypothetical protein
VVGFPWCIGLVVSSTIFSADLGLAITHTI